MWNLKQLDTNELIYKTETDAQTQRMNLQVAGVWRGREDRGRDSQGVWDGQVHITYLKWITHKDLWYSTGNSAQCHVAAWMGGEFGGEQTHAYVWMSPFAVDLKLL